MIYLDFSAKSLEFTVRQQLNVVRVMSDALAEDVEEVLRWEFEPHEYEKAIASCDDLKRSLIELSAVYDFYVWKLNNEQGKEIDKP